MSEKLPARFGQRRHGDVARLDALRRPRRLVVAEEEDLAALQRPADRAAGLVLFELRAFGREEIAGVKVGVAEELEHVAVEHVAARLRDDVDDAAVVVAVLGIEVVGEQAELFDRIEIRHDTRAAVHAFLHVAAVDVEAVRGFALAAHRHDAGIEPAGGCHRTGHAGHDDAVRLNRRRRNDAGLNRQQIRVAAAVQRQRRHRRRRDDLAELGRHGVDADGVDGHRDRFRLLAQLERDVDLDRAVGIDLDAGPLLRLEPVDLHRHFISGDGELGERVQALSIGRRREHRAQRDVRRGLGAREN